MYGGVPANWGACASDGSKIVVSSGSAGPRAAMPKSTSFTEPAGVTTTLDGLTSRWMTPC